MLSGCVTAVKPDACDQLFAAATAPDGTVPTDTLGAAQLIARNSWYKPERLFALLEAFYAIPPGKTMLDAPYMPYLRYAPSAWVLPLKFDGGGYRAGGKAMFDSEGNLWVGNNFTIGWQGQDTLWQGNASKFAPNGKPLSPITTGFAGGGMQGGTFGAAVDTHDNAWLSSYGGKSITVFDKTGKPLTPPEGITFDGTLGLMQGIIGDSRRRCLGAWASARSQLLFFPQGDFKNGRIVCEGRQGRALQVPPRAVSSRHRPAGPHLGDQRLRRPHHSLPGQSIRARPRSSTPAGAAAASASTARAMSG